MTTSLLFRVDFTTRPRGPVFIDLLLRDVLWTDVFASGDFFSFFASFVSKGKKREQKRNDIEKRNREIKSKIIGPSASVEFHRQMR